MNDDSSVFVFQNVLFVHLKCYFYSVLQVVVVVVVWFLSLERWTSGRRC